MAHILKVSDNRYINIDKISYVVLSETNTSLHIWFAGENEDAELVLYGEDGATVLDYIDGIAFQIPDYMKKG